ncbi:MAG: S-layer homology domain-containing protein, partial [Armatimonadetes bacterium]|nr:S-layer homology domain-containing protein [Armatimonadota bacterium]
MKKAIVLLTLLLALAAPVFAGPFADLPPSHWALDAVNQLSAKGLLEGYPDGTFKGDRAASRYEVAMAVARVLAKVEKMGQADLSNLATKSDLAALRKLINEFRDELDALGVRVAKAEDKIAALESRVTELERVKISGMLHAMATSTGVDYKRDLPGGIRVSGPRTTNGASIAAATAGVFGAGATDYTTLFMNPANALPLTSGTGLTMMGELTAKAKLSPEWNGGVTLAAWNQIGDAPNSYTWGATPPYLSNPFLMGAANNLRVTLDRAWVEKPSTGFEGTVGSFTPYLLPEIIYKGMPNVTYYGPNYLPLYGGDVRGKLENMGWLPTVSYEVFGSRLPAATYVPYGQILLGASAQTEFPNSNLKARLNFQRAYDEDFGTAGVTAGTVPTPWWIFSFGAGTTAGPQEQNTWGIDLEYPLPFWKNWTFSAGYASSSYVANRAPTPAAMNAKNSVQGQMIRADLSGKLGAADIGLEYFVVSPYYDPMVLWKDNMFSIFGNTATQPDYFSWFGMWELPYPTVYSLPMGLL